MNFGRSVLAVLLTLAGATAGCGTIVTRRMSNPDWETTVYSGTRLDAVVVCASVIAPFSGDEGAIAFLALPFGLVDLPLSLVVDTVLLPLTLSEEFGNQREDFRALVAAIEAGDLGGARTIAEGRSELLHGSAGDKGTPLHLAVANGQLELVEWVASETARDNAEDASGETPLFLALRAERVDLVRTLLEHGADPNYLKRSGWTPLHAAAAQKDPALAEALLDHGASLEARTEQQVTPLHVAAEENSDLVAALLLARGADVDARSNRGRTPLLTAASQGSLATARVLLSHGADVNARTEDWGGGLFGMNSEKGRTPLGEALRWKHAEMVDLLRSQGGVE